MIALTIMTPEQLEIIKAADELEAWLYFNVGETADFPVRLKCDCTEAANALCARLDALRNALRPYRNRVKV